MNPKINNQIKIQNSSGNGIDYQNTKRGYFHNLETQIAIGMGYHVDGGFRHFHCQNLRKKEHKSSANI